jgi:hypothetical protein
MIIIIMTSDVTPEFALVHFTKDRVFDIIHVSHITSFHPKTVSDFKKDKLYKVGWTDDARSRLNKKTAGAISSTSFPAVVVQLSGGLSSVKHCNVNLFFNIT